jgi:hypothetical protein
MCGRRGPPPRLPKGRRPNELQTGHERPCHKGSANTRIETADERRCRVRRAGGPFRLAELDRLQQPAADAGLVIEAGVEGNKIVIEAEAEPGTENIAGIKKEVTPISTELAKPDAGMTSVGLSLLARRDGLPVIVAKCARYTWHEAASSSARSA